METVEITLFAFAELSDDAKARARDWYRYNALDYDCWQFVYDDFESVCELLGITLKTSTVRLMGGGTRHKPCVYFRGFWSQGDGACFEGRYRYRKGSAKKIRAYAPVDQGLHRIADALANIQRRNFYQVWAECGHRGHYYHEYSMTVDVGRGDADVSPDDEVTLRECLRDLARWLYGRLEADFEHLNSDEAVDEAMEINAYRFREDGSVFH
jgi:hypothetical protein